MNLTTQNPPAAGEAAREPCSRQALAQHRAIEVGLCPQCFRPKGHERKAHMCDSCAAKHRVFSAVSNLRRAGIIPDHFTSGDIVRACNSHDNLVEALNILDEVRGAIMLAEVEGGSSELAYDVERVISEARAALEAIKAGAGATKKGGRK